MKPIFNNSIKTLLFVIIALLIFNAFVLLSGGLWRVTRAKSLYQDGDVLYRTNKITGTTYILGGNEEYLIIRK